MKPVYLHGMGLWIPGFPDPEAWCRGEPNSDASRPPAKLLQGALRRRASLLTRMSVEVFDQATSQSRVDAAAIPSIWATAHGEHDTAIKLLKMMRRGEGKLSPTHFHNSVHNTPSGYASIALGNGMASTTLTGGPELVASSLLEAFCLLDAGTPKVVVVLADEPLKIPFERQDMQVPLALSFCISSEPESASVRLTGLRREALPAQKPHERLGGFFVSAGLLLLERAVARQPGTIALEIVPDGQDRELTWCLDLELVAAR